MRNVTRMFVLIAVGALLLVSTPHTDAVVGEKTITGLPPNTTVTIALPDGTTVEEETDDDGKLVYLFPKGKSTITWAGGSKVVKAGWTAGKTTGVTIGGIAGAVAVATALDDSSSTTGSSGSVQALSVDNVSSASQLGLNVGDTIPLTCLTNSPPGTSPSDAGCSCDHIHGSLTVPSQKTSASDFDPSGCGHGCVVTTSSPTVTC